MKQLTITAFNTLKAIEEYQYITAQQLVDCGASKSARSVRESLVKQLDSFSPSLINTMDLGAIPKIGRLPKMYSLTKQGAFIIAEAEGKELFEIQYPKRVPQLANDFFHRIACVDFHIAFNKFMEESESEVFAFDRYFSKVYNDSRKLIAKTTVSLSDKYLTPDAVLHFRHNEKNRVCAVELHNYPKVNRILKQLENHVQALKEGAFYKRYGETKANFVLNVFTDEKVMKLVQNRFCEIQDYEKVKPLFLFSYLNNLNSKNFKNSWSLFNLESSSFLKKTLNSFI